MCTIVALVLAYYAIASTDFTRNSPVSPRADVARGSVVAELADRCRQTTDLLEIDGHVIEMSRVASQLSCTFFVIDFKTLEAVGDT